MASHAEQLRDLAWECRTIAATVRGDQVREHLRAVADQFERLAELYQKTAEASWTRDRY